MLISGLVELVGQEQGNQSINDYNNCMCIIHGGLSINTVSAIDCTHRWPIRMKC